MTKLDYAFCTTWLLLAAACGADGRDATAPGAHAAPAPTRGYLADPGRDAHRTAHVAPPAPAAPLDPADVTVDQPENVRVNP